MIRKLWRGVVSWLPYIGFWAALGLLLVIYLNARGF